MSSFLVLLLLIGCAIAIYVFCYNSLMAAKVRVDEGWSGITVQLKRRHALVPNLVQAARTAMSHEEAILDRIIEARSSALEALAGNNQGAIAQAEERLSQALGSFVAYTEDNPQITANENLALLQKQLEETEDQVAASRRIFNGNVAAYNTRLASIPWNIVAGMKGLTPSDMFEVDDSEMKRISQDPTLDGLQASLPQSRSTPE